jgi:TolB-like protein
MRFHATKLTGCGLVVILLLSALTSAAQDQADTTLVVLVALPFRNVTSDAEAKTYLMPIVRERLTTAGFGLIEDDLLQDLLRRDRVRDTGQLSQQQAQEISRETGTNWILIGSIDCYRKGDQPEIGLSARLLNSYTGEVVWAATRSATGADHTGLLGLGVITSADRLAELAIDDMIQELREWWMAWFVNAQVIVGKSKAKSSIMVIPLEYTGSLTTAGQMTDNILVSLLMQRGYRVIEPGALNQQLSASGIAPRDGIDLATLKTLQESLDADYCLTGAAESYQETDQFEENDIPTVQVSLRLLKAESGQLIWARQVEHRGDDFVKIFQLGRVYGTSRLMALSLKELVSALPPETLQPSPQHHSEE